MHAMRQNVNRIVYYQIRFFLEAVLVVKMYVVLYTVHEILSEGLVQKMDSEKLQLTSFQLQCSIVEIHRFGLFCIIGAVL